MDRLKKYDFLDENGHRLEDYADYLAIFSEHEAELARVKAAGIEALRRAEQAEARAEKAESDKAALEEDLEATEKNLKEFSGFIEELLSGLKHRFPVQYADLEGDEYGDDAFSSHDLFEFVIDPAVNAAQKAEAEVARLQQRVNELLSEELTDCAVRERIQLRFNMHEVLQQNERLTKMVDWLAKALAEDGCPYLALWSDFGSEMRPDWCICIDTADDGFDCNGDPKECWKKEAARKS